MKSQYETRPSVHQLSEMPYLRGIQRVVKKTVSENVSEKKYKSAKLFHAEKDISKPWYVYFYYRHPEWTPTCNVDVEGKKIEKYQRFRVKAHINRTHSVRGRLKEGRLLRNAINELLREGWSPFIVSELSGTKWERTDTALREVVRLKKKKVSKETHSSHRSSVGAFIDWLRERNLAHLPPDLIERRNILEYLNELTESRGLSNNTRNNNLNYIRGMFSYMYARELITRNPTTGIEKLPVIYGEKNTPLTEEETNTVIEHLAQVHPKLLLFSNIMYGCGIRGKEICRLNVEDVNLQRGEILLKGVNAKAHKRDHIVIPEYLIEDVRSYLHGRPKSYPLFSAKWECTKKRLVRNRVSELWKKLVKDGLGIDKDMYGLRHKSAVDLRDAGFDLLETRDFLRHSSVTQTEKYMRSVVARNKEKLKKKMPRLGGK